MTELAWTSLRSYFQVGKNFVQQGSGVVDFSSSSLQALDLSGVLQI